MIEVHALPGAAVGSTMAQALGYEFSADRVRSCVPAELRALDQWVGWQEVPVPGRKPTKKPRQTSGKPADSTDPGTWGSFEACVEAAESHPMIDGVGFVFTDQDDYVGFDFDECFDAEGKLHPTIERWVYSLRSYTEVSPSGNGLHTIVKGVLPGNRHRTRFQSIGFEVYETKRFFTMTGVVWGGSR